MQCIVYCKEILCYTLLYSVILWFTLLYSVILCYTLLYYIKAPDGANTINISIYQYKVCYQQEAEPRTRGKGIKSEPVRIKPQWGSRIFVLQIWYDRSDMVTMQWGRWTLKTSSSGDHLTLCGLLLQVSHLFSRIRHDQTSEKGCDRMFISNLLNSARS